MNLLRQNSTEQLERLAAQRNLYAKVKRIHAGHIILAVPIAVLSAVISMAIPDLRGYIAIWAICATLVDILWLTPWQERVQYTAAGIQEQFDCDVLSLPWNELKGGARPDFQMILEESHKDRHGESDIDSLMNWYSPEIVVLPDHIGRLVCQWANCRWDSKQRKLYAFGVCFLVVCFIALSLCYSLIISLSLENVIMKCCIPFMPSAFFAIRQYRAHTSAAKRLDNMCKYINNLWRDAFVQGGGSELTYQSRNLQDEILECRRRNPVIFDWVYKVLRRRFEEEMICSTQGLIQDARKKLGLNSGQ